MIRPEKWQFNWKPKTKSKDDLKLVKDLVRIMEELELTKTQLTRLALDNFVKEYPDAVVLPSGTRIK